ncbi:MAG: hypothetical protein HYX81_02530 [Chloroflexi bacterium]|nr:hypothetical protein [Chloroflexota bacterium]
MRLYKKFLTALLVILLITLATTVPTQPAAAAAGTLLLTAITSGPPGAAVSVTGTGYTTGNTYTVTFGTLNVASGTVVDGGFSAVFPVPTLPRASYTVTATTTGAVNDTTPSPPSFAITPQIFLSTNSATVGDPVVVSGNGFAASQTVNIFFDSATLISSISNATGSFSGASFIVAEQAAGIHTLSAGDLTGQSPSPSVSLSITPKISLSTTIVAVGSTFTVSGNGFAASSTISFLLDDVSIGTTATSNANGTIPSTSLTIPTTRGGSRTFTVKDAAGNLATATITISATMSINPGTGPAGTTVTVAGKGFLAGASILLTYSGTSITTTPIQVITDINGSFSATFVVPPSASGSYPVVASDGVNVSSANFSSVATASISPVRGNIGTFITASGAGFKSNSTVTINFRTFQAGTANTDDKGSFTATFAALPSGAGNQTITITDQVNTLTFTFTVVPSAKINLTSGFVGTDVAVTGTGFAASRSLTVSYDAAQVTSGTTDGNGTFTVAFKAPVSKGGDHLVTVTDSTNTSTFTFAMDATPPAAPSLLLPARFAKADAMPVLDWSDVTDPSGVTYTLQLSRDATFASILLEKKDLTASAYKLTEKETLQSVSKSRPYYWRVKAIDAASNESDWPTPSAFFVGFVLATWALYTIFGVVALGLGVLGYWLGRRSVT